MVRYVLVRITSNGKTSSTVVDNETGRELMNAEGDDARPTKKRRLNNDDVVHELQTERRPRVQKKGARGKKKGKLGGKKGRRRPGNDRTTKRRKRKYMSDSGSGSGDDDDDEPGSGSEFFSPSEGDSDNSDDEEYAASASSVSSSSSSANKAIVARYNGLVDAAMTVGICGEEPKCFALCSLLSGVTNSTLTKLRAFQRYKDQFSPRGKITLHSHKTKDIVLAILSVAGFFSPNAKQRGLTVDDLTTLHAHYHKQYLLDMYGIKRVALYKAAGYNRRLAQSKECQERVGQSQMYTEFVSIDKGASWTDQVARMKSEAEEEGQAGQQTEKGEGEEERGSKNEGGGSTNNSTSSTATTTATATTSASATSPTTTATATTVDGDSLINALADAAAAAVVSDQQSPTPMELDDNKEEEKKQEKREKQEKPQAKEPQATETAGPKPSPGGGVGMCGPFSAPPSPRPDDKEPATADTPAATSSTPPPPAAAAAASCPSDPDSDASSTAEIPAKPKTALSADA